MELSESEGVFTTAQAERVGIPRDALHDAVQSGRLERIRRGAYRLMGSGAKPEDELVAIWKLTAPDQFAYERMRENHWDGIAVGGTSAAALLELGDFYLSPYRFLSSHRISTRIKSAHFAMRQVSRADVIFSHGLPLTNLERTMMDLILDHEDPSLIIELVKDIYSPNSTISIDYDRFLSLLSEQFGKTKARQIIDKMLLDAGVSPRKAAQ